MTGAATALMGTPASVADYLVLRPLGDSGRYLLATPPERLGLGGEAVALKVSAGMGSGAPRVLRELRLYASLDSPHLVRLLDAGQEGDVFFYAMPLHPAGSLSRPATTMSTELAVAAVAAAARGAHDLHEAGLAHADIQPARILLGPGVGDSGRIGGGAVAAVLADLELARSVTPGLTLTREMPVGDLAYVDPAVVRGSRPGRAGDVWALAATLHRVVTGVGVYPGLPGDLLAAVRHVLSGAPQLDPSLPESLRPVVAAALSVDPADRPATARQLAEELEAMA